MWSCFVSLQGLYHLGKLINIVVINIQVDVNVTLVGSLVLPHANTGSDATPIPCMMSHEVISLLTAPRHD